MGVERSKPEDDVDSLFSEIELDPRGALTLAHSAVTMRPEPGQNEVGASAVRVVSVAVATTPPSARQALAAAPPPSLAEPLAIVHAARGIVGHVVRDADGAVMSHGPVDARFAERVAYVTRLAALVGDELGLEGLREVHAVGADRRVAALLARDGASLAVLAAADAEIEDLSGRRR